ncbi:MAG: hypothetical protein K2Q34_01300 [Alphaproteobacteria bacterium]|nr:hypothetical protein [Alphaproteobacteria bacterium]
MKKIYSLLVLILFINDSLARDNERYDDGMMDELLKEGSRLPDSCYYAPSATHAPRTYSLVLTAIGKLTEEDNYEAQSKALISPPEPEDEMEIKRKAALDQLSDLIKDNNFQTIYELVSFLAIVFNPSNPRESEFDLVTFKTELLECETPYSQKELIQAEKMKYETPQ